MKIGLALGGGAARGLAHLGVLEVLGEARIPVHYVSGCSAGSVIGALYCSGYTVAELLPMIPFIHWRRILTKARSSEYGLFDFDKLERLLLMIIGDIEFSDLEIPLSVATMDFNTGDRVILQEGSVARAVRASCSVPGIIEPVEVDGQLLVDGGIVDNLPVELARKLGAEFVIGVDVFQPNYARQFGPLGIGLTAVETLIRNSGGGVGMADFLIKPETAGTTYVRLSQHRELVKAGRKAARDRLPDLLTELRWQGL